MGLGMKKKLTKRPLGLAQHRPFVRRTPTTVPAFPKAPRELAGKWVAWSAAGEILASGDTFAEVVKAGEGRPGVSYERLPKLERVH